MDPFVVTCVKRSFRGDAEWARGEALTAVVDGDRAIEAFMEFDPGLGIAASAGSREDLEEMRRQRDRVVVGDGDLVLEAEDGLRIPPIGPGPKGGIRMSGGLGEAGVVPLEKAGEEGIGGLDVRDAGEPQFDDEAILKRAALALDPSLGLWRGCRHPLDAELL
jgi:hypothetical protein